MQFNLTKFMDFLYGLTEDFGMAIMFGAIVVVFVVALTEWLVMGRMP